ncbi:FusB/FusC family EF-G-binding protein [Thalassobacillus sp. C254]|uniref:FusB/FusC family EF-G-binding protein n=1 Tax=Thalassobacillus sp. C254 TaxID=1225341 RepID=UPI0006CFFD00|nr:elongation factor G-binding protein [Thalassobacillus sp. C254]
MEPFIYNHQYNFIKQQAFQLQKNYLQVKDESVISAVKANAEEKILAQFEGLTNQQRQMLGLIIDLKQEQDFHNYLHSLSSYILSFPSVSEDTLRKLFKKNKKLNLPALEEIDFSKLTYLGWNDISLQKKFIVYEQNGQWIGIEGKYTPARHKNICFFCQKQTKVSFVSAVTNATSTSDPNYYKSLGHYICSDSQECNENITHLAALENFMEKVKEPTV